MTRLQEITLGLGFLAAIVVSGSLSQGLFAQADDDGTGRGSQAGSSTPTINEKEDSRLAVEGSTLEVTAGLFSDDMLSERQWRDLDETVDRGLRFLSSQQTKDGSFEAYLPGQPAITSLCIIAFLSRGHLPGEGPYGEPIESALDYVLSTQQEDGSFSALDTQHVYWSNTTSYNHAIAGLMLGEVYGMTGSTQQDSVRVAIERALAFTHRKQHEPKRHADDQGGWRYMKPTPDLGSDLSVTSWQLMFYRSARNAGFDVPQEDIEAAVGFVRRAFDPHHGTFSYGLRGKHRLRLSRAMAGAGILSLSLAGQHQSDMARRAGDYLLKHPFDRFNSGGLTGQDRFYYGAYYASLATFQLGADYWERFYPDYLQLMKKHQNRNGSWDRDTHSKQRVLGFCYTTSLSILSLTPPYQLLPIYQR